MAGRISTGTFSFIVVAVRFVIMYIYSMVNTDVCGQLGIRETVLLCEQDADCIECELDQG